MIWSDAFEKLKKLAAPAACKLASSQWHFGHQVSPEEGRQWEAYIEGMGHFNGSTPEEALAAAERGLEQRILNEAIVKTTLENGGGE